MPEQNDKFAIYSWGLIYASVCTLFDAEEAEARLNREMPSGTTHGWRFHGERFSDGSDNPHPCEEKPETHKHYLFSC